MIYVNNLGIFGIRPRPRFFALGHVALLNPLK